VISANGGTLKAVTTGGKEFALTYPTWSPDGRKLAFAGTPAGEFRGRLFSDIYIVAAAGGSPRRLTDTPRVIEQDLAWSPAGKWIAYTETNARPKATHGGGPYGKRGVWIVSTTNGAKRLRVANGLDHSPGWSPDSSSVAFVRDVGQRTTSTGTLEPIRSIFEVPANGDRGPLPPIVPSDRSALPSNHSILELDWAPPPPD
jgi:Periplasmic component of the Tol biopolymer transport system